MRKLFNNETFLRITSVVIAAFLWMYVISIRNPNATVTIKNVPINIINSAKISNQNLKIIRISNKTTDVRVSGRRSDVAKVTQDDITLNVDANQIGGASEYYLKISSSVNAQGVSITGLASDSVNIYVDYVISVEHKINISVSGNAKTGYIATDATLDKTSVIVQGPKSIVDSVGEIRADVDISEADKEVSKITDLIVYDLSGDKMDMTYLKLSFEQASVKVPVYHTKQVPVVATVPDNLEAHLYTVTVVPETVTIYGKSEIIENINEIKTLPFSLPIDGTEVKKKIGLMVPENVFLVDDITEIDVNIKNNKLTEE